MKGIVADCLKKLVAENFGIEKWTKIMKMSGLNPDKSYAITDDVDDELILKLFDNTCQVSGLSFEQACDVFGKYWVGSYIPKRYPDFYTDVKSVKEFLLKLDNIHSTMTKRLENAKPPKHSYKWKNENTLMMGYESNRDLIELFIGAVKGAARYFEDEIAVRKINRQEVEIDFIL